MLTILFFVFLFPVFHHFGGFPLSMLILNILKREKNWKKLNYVPSVSVIVVTRNGEASIGLRIENILASDYPEDKIELIIMSDNSEDNTVEILKKYPKVRSFQSDKRVGKAALLNKAVKTATGKILIFTDDNTEFDKENIRELVKPFYYHDISAVCGKLILKGNNHLEALYWNMESFYKSVEGKFNCVIGANGANYAVRREIYAPLPEDRLIMDDFINTMNILSHAGNMVYNRAAFAFEEHGTGLAREFERKARIGRGNANALPYIWKMLRGSKKILSAYFMISHKLLRWFMPPILIILFIISGLFSMEEFDLITLFFLLQATAYIFGGVVYFMKKPISIVFWSSFALFFGMVVNPKTKVPYWDV